MSGEIIDQPEASVIRDASISAPVVACMGTAACRRVCEFVSPSNELQAGDPSYALPLEQDCTVLDSLSAHSNEVVSELLATVTLPELGALHGDALVNEAKGFLTHLTEADTAFDGHLQSLLRGVRQPRFALKTAEQAYAASQTYESDYMPATDKDKEELLAFHGVLRGFHDKDTLDRTGLLFDGAMQQMFTRAARELGVGHHIKLVGEPGIAKTTFAKYLALQNAIAHRPGLADSELMPTVISFSSTSEAESQVSEQTFQEATLGAQLGKIGKAMKEGLGVVLDEQNGMTADQQTFFNDLFLKKPGDMVTVENETFTIAKGFCVIATLNAMTDTQGNRRHGRQQQDSANAARFSRLDFAYPHQEGYLGNSDETISRIFLAHYVDSFGWQIPDTTVVNLLDNTNELMRNITKMATEPARDGTTTSITAKQARPDLAECVSPRDLGRILELGFAYGDSASAVATIRTLMHSKVQQILNSDNGHHVPQKVKDAVNGHLRTGNFHA